MLKIMREQAGSWFIKIILGAIVLVFIFWGVGTFDADRLAKVATVNDAIITANEYEAAYNRLVNQYRQYGMNIDEKTVTRLREQALEQLIDRQLMLQEAQRLNFKVTDGELVEDIREMSVFQNEGGSFDKQLYNRVLSANRLTPEGFEISHREDMLLRKLTSFIQNGVKVSEAEMREWYNWKKGLVKIEYAYFDPATYPEVEPTEEELLAYYTANPSRYMTLPKRKAQYVRFGFEKYKADISVTPEEIEAYFAANPDEFKQEKMVKARHILFKVDENAPEELVEEKRKAAEAVVVEARENPDNFAELAKTHSEGPTKDKGGDLGEFGRGRMVAPFEEKAFSMAEGEISDPVRTRFGWHIIKVEGVKEEKVFSLEESREKIEGIIRDEKAKSMAYDDADQFFRAAPEDQNMKAAAESKGLEVLETDYLQRGQAPEGMTDGRKFSAVAFQLGEMQVSEPTEVGDGYMVIQVLENVAPELEPLEKVRDRVKADWLRNRHEEMALADAEKFLAALKSGDELNETRDANAAKETENGEAAEKAETVEVTEAAEEAETTELSGKIEETQIPELKETDFFEREGTIPDIGFKAQVSEAAFALSPENPLPEKPVKAGTGYYVIRFKERKAPDDEGFTAEKEAIHDQLLRQKQSKVVQEWLAILREKSKIEKDQGMVL